jgi:hypothetical protein
MQLFLDHGTIMRAERWPPGPFSLVGVRWLCHVRLPRGSRILGPALPDALMLSRHARLGHNRRPQCRA